MRPLTTLAQAFLGRGCSRPQPVNESRTRARVHWLLTVLGALALAVTGTPGAASAPERGDELQLANAQHLDARLAAIIYRLAAANADKCPQIMPGTGFVIHTLEQYPAALYPAARTVFGFETSLAIGVVVPGSPADSAGLRVNDSIVAINGTPVREAAKGEHGTSLRRDEIERALVRLPAQAPIAVRVRRSGQTLDLTLTPRPACRTRHEVRFGLKDIAWSDGETIQFSDQFTASAEDQALAAIAAHELAHTALEHNRKLQAKAPSVPHKSGASRKVGAVRAAEDEADLYSLAILRDAGFDPRIVPAFWRGAGRKLGGGILRKRTHASPAERARMLDLEIEKVMSGDLSQER